MAQIRFFFQIFLQRIQRPENGRFVMPGRGHRPSASIKKSFFASFGSQKEAFPSLFLPLGAHQDLAFADMVGSAHDAVLFHLLYQFGGAVVADLQMALNERGARLPLPGDESDSLIVESVLTVGIAADRPGDAGVSSSTGSVTSSR